MFPKRSLGVEDAKPQVVAAMPALLRRIRWRVPRICHDADANMRAIPLAYTTFR